MSARVIAFELEAFFLPLKIIANDLSLSYYVSTAGDGKPAIAD